MSQRVAHAFPLRSHGRRGPAGDPDAQATCVETGDEIRSIEGIFSGTLAYLFNVFDGKRAFSEIVREAKARGYTEPDPRDDLSGMDVARKAVILAREVGLDLELADIEVESLVPAALAKASVDEFLKRLPDFDAADARARAGGAAQRPGPALRRGDRRSRAQRRRASAQLCAARTRSRTSA